MPHYEKRSWQPVHLSAHKSRPTMTEKPSLTAALETRAQPQEQRNVKQLLERMKPEIQKALHSEAAVERLMRMYLTAIRLNPKLYECTDESLAAALLLSAQVDLEPGPLGHVYLVPYGNECTWILGYTGIAELARRSGSVAGLDAEIVWDCDEYRYWRDEKGQHFTHTPGDEGKRKERLKVIVTWQERAGSKRAPRGREGAKWGTDRAKKAGPAVKKGGGLWVTDEGTGWAHTGLP